MQMSLQKNFEFFRLNEFDDYRDNEWIAIFDEKIIAHGSQLKQVMNRAKTIAPIAKVLFSRVKKTASYL